MIKCSIPVHIVPDGFIADVKYRDAVLMDINSPTISRVTVAAQMGILVDHQALLSGIRGFTRKNRAPKTCINNKIIISHDLPFLPSIVTRD